MEFCLSPRESQAFTTDHPQPILEIIGILSQLSEKSELAPFSGPGAERGFDQSGHEGSGSENVKINWSDDWNATVATLCLCRPWAVSRNEQLRIRSRYLLSPSDPDQNKYVKTLKDTFHIAFLGLIISLNSIVCTLWNVSSLCCNSCVNIFNGEEVIAKESLVESLGQQIGLVFYVNRKENFQFYWQGCKTWPDKNKLEFASLLPHLPMTFLLFRFIFQCFMFKI